MSAPYPVFYRKKNAAATIYFPLYDPAADDKFESTPVSFAAGDSLVQIDGGAFGNTSATPQHEGNGIYSIALIAAETNGGTSIVVIKDQTAPNAWVDFAFAVETEDARMNPLEETITELTAAPAVGAQSYANMIRWLYHRFKNLHKLSAGVLTVMREDDVTPLSTQATSDDNVTQQVDRAV